MAGAGPLLTLNNGVRMPALGLGVFQSRPEQTTDAVASALVQGYRLIDTAAAYFNERQVGEGIARGGVARSKVFVTTKLWLTDYGYESTLRAFEVSRRKLGLEYVDLYLLHWPVPADFGATVAAYRAAEKLLADGRVRAIGVTKSVRPERIAENAGIFDFQLSPDEIAAIDALDSGVRGGPDPEAVDAKTFGLTIPD